MADPTPTPSFDTAPRLQSTAADPTTAYAPIAWSAVAALGIGGLFVFILLLLGYTSFQKKEPLDASWLFVLPVIGIAVAFVARRQIASSEGTRIGTQYANAGWWLCVVGGLVYAAYLGTLEYTIRADAAAQFRSWTDELTGVDPDAPDQPALFTAFYRTLPPQERSVFNPDSYTADKDADGSRGRAARADMRTRYAPDLLQFREHPIVLQMARYGADCRFDVDGLKEWKYQGGRIEATLAATMTTPEGDFPLVVPMAALVEKGTRDWRVKLVAGNAAAAPRLTPYGFLVVGWVTGSARLAVEQMLTAQQVAAYRTVIGTNEFAGGVGGLPAVIAAGSVPPYAEFVARPPVTLPGGVGEPPDARLRDFRTAWESKPNRFRLTDILGEGLAENPSTPVIEVSADRLLVKMSLQYKPLGIETPGAGVRMKLVMECTDPAVLGELAAARATAATDARTSEVPKDSPLQSKGPIQPGQWKLLRLESDLQVLLPPQSAGPPGGPPGM